MIATRFAPSPTGSLHVGSARTAIFNWVFARKHGGKFYLRIDDTHQSRNIDGLASKIQYELKWLDIEWDGIYYQSQRSELYEQIIEYLLDEGYAYNRVSHDGSSCVCFDVDSVTTEERIIKDSILGEVKFNSSDIKDFVIQRGDGTPLYNLATVVDDIELNISHVIRGQEHLTNTFSQLLIYEALNKIPPTFAHIPFICAPDSNKKLSKRDLTVDATIESYIENGYLPEALVNYLSHLGWALDGKTELWDIETLVEKFDIADVSTSSAKFDPHKLMWVQSQYMKNKSYPEKTMLIDSWLSSRKEYVPYKQLLSQIIELMEDRLKIAKDIVPYLHFIREKYFHIDPRSYERFLNNPYVKELLEDYLEHLRLVEITPIECIQDIKDGSKFIYELAVKIAKKHGQKPALLINALRAATTGQPIGFGVFEGMSLLGKVRCISRIERTLMVLQ